MAVITVDSVQSGSQTIASSDGTTINITISSVTTSRSIDVPQRTTATMKRD